MQDTTLRGRNLTKIIVAGILSSLTVMTLHIYLVQLITPIVAHQMAGKVIPQPPYSFSITLLAYITALLPGIGMVVLYALIRPQLSMTSKLSRGLTFFLLIALFNSDFIRQPIMNYAVGNPLSVVLLLQIKVWLPIILLVFIIVSIID